MQDADGNDVGETSGAADLARLQLQSAFSAQQKGDLSEAKNLYAEVLKLDPYHVDALHMSAVISRKLKSYVQAEVLFVMALCAKCDFAPTYSNFGLLLNDLKRFDEAIVNFEKAVLLQPDFPEAYYNRGVSLQALKKFETARRSFDFAITLKPDFIEAYYSRAESFRLEKRLSDALSSYEKIILIKPEHAFAHNDCGVILKELGRLDEAVVRYDAAISLKPHYAGAHVNRGNALTKLKRFDEAVASYDEAIAIKPDYTDAYRNRGIVLNELKRHREALASYDQALAIRPDYADALNDRGNALYLMGMLHEALTSYDRAAALNPDFPWLTGRRVHLRMKISDWSECGDRLAGLAEDILARKSAATPFAVLGLFDDSLVQSTAARQFLEQNYRLTPLPWTTHRRRRNGKIRIGYFSADFRMHPMSQLMAGIVESHDRSRFELIAFSFGFQVFDQMRSRMQGAFDQFIDVHLLGDREIAEMTRDLEIDIAVDLMGFTAEGRPGIFSLRCAPIQVNYLGYPGTMSADFMDYIMADHVVIPPSDRQFYTEKIIYLPHSYYPNSYKLDAPGFDSSRKEFTREELGLPREGFVFCCFNNSYKITPIVFESWMRILRAAEGSVLWLLDDNIASAGNLRVEAANRGVAPDRLVFAERAPISDHLARHRCADLFLDTLPYNAHTTGTDALWGGAPVLTLIGVSFAGRVAASLLSAVGLPELVTTCVADYEKLAIRLATHPDEIKALKQKLAEKRSSSKLFDTNLYVKHIEAAFTAMYDRHQAGLAPDHIFIDG